MESQNFIILILGDSNTGKTTIIGRYLDNKYIEAAPTQGIEKKESLLDIDRSKKAQIYDTSGNDKYRSQVVSEFKNASAVVLVYDITDYQSYQNIHTLHKEVMKSNPNVDYWIVVGNKSDLKDQRKVNPDEVKKFAQTIGARFIECSARQPCNINLIFLTIQQWTQMQIQPKLVPESTQRLLEKLNQGELNQTNLSKNNIRQKSKNMSFTQNVSFDDQQHSFTGDNMQDYFAQLSKQVDTQSQRLADEIVEQAQQNVFKSLETNQLSVHQNKSLFLEESMPQEQQKKIDNIQIMQQKHKQLDKLRKEISQNLQLVYDQQKKLTTEQVKENAQTIKLEKELQRRLLSVEKNMTLLKTEILLNQKSFHFSTNKNNFLTIDQTQILKQHISQIHDPAHMKEQNEYIEKIKKERKKLEELRQTRFKEHMELIQKEEKKQREEQLKAGQLQIEKRKERALEKIASMDKIRQERSSIISKQNEQVKQLIQTTPLHVKLENTYQEQTTTKQLEDHKQKLKQIRDLHQPVRLNDLKQWEDSYEKRRKSQEDLRQEKIKKNSQVTYQASYESSAYKQIKQELQNLEKEKLLTLKEQQSKHQAKEEFLLKLKEYHPSISPEKQQELEQIMNKVHHKIDFYEFIEMTKKVKQKAVFFDKDGKIQERNIDEEYYQKIKENERNDEQNGRDLGNKYFQDARKVIKKPSLHEGEKAQTQTNHDKTQTRNPKLNKLNEIKSHWKLKPKLIFEEADLEKVIKGNEVVGFSNEHVMEEANKLASEAVRKMQILEAKGNKNSNFKDMESADKLLINSIKAKLTLMEKDLQSDTRTQETQPKQKRGRSNTKYQQ